MKPLLPLQLCLAIPLLLLALPAPAIEALDDADLSAVSGAGIAIALEDWRFAMEPTGYMEQTGSDWAGARPAGLSFRRGDLRWYGFTMSGVGGVGPRVRAPARASTA